MSAGVQDDPRIQVILDLLLQLARGEHHVEAKASERGDELDAIITGVGMLREELQASFASLRQSHAELEDRVRARTAELARVNEQLRHELDERIRAEQTLGQAQEQLLQAQKMEAVGRLAGGIAHDFNNALTVINGVGQVLIDDLQPSDPLRGDLEEIVRAGKRAEALTRQLLTFSRRQVVQQVVLDLDALLAGLAQMLRRLVGEDVELVVAASPEPARIKADPGQLEQAIVNLVVNARDAMPEGGTLRLDLSMVDLPGGAEPRLPPGPYVVLKVQDDGEGMDRATLGRIFEPFFTTKPQGKGTGLGLSTVYGIVEQCGGTVLVESAPGKGTTFRLYFPRTAERAEAARRHATPSVGGRETILLVKDEEPVRRVLAGVLGRRGYKLLEAKNAGEAMLLAEQHPGPIHLLLTDVVMPQLSGPALAQRLGALRPDLRVLFISGYTDNATLHRAVLEAGAAFLQKPIAPEELRAKVREVLDAAP